MWPGHQSTARLSVSADEDLATANVIRSRHIALGDGALWARLRELVAGYFAERDRDIPAAQ